ncbi:MAG: hypothetical protein IJ523_01010 [Succinivibrionaceae bacterium]|nr:hypothetical protein [Succinivibrionaceae bacterium]
MRDISEELQKRGFKASKDLAGRILDELGCSRQANQKRKQAEKSNTSGDEMFKRINLAIEECFRQGAPAISADTKKKELIGNSKNNGAERRKEKDGSKVPEQNFR